MLGKLGEVIDLPAMDGFPPRTPGIAYNCPEHLLEDAQGSFLQGG